MTGLAVKLMVQAKFREGDRVIYHPTGAGNESIGTIKRVLKEPPMANLPSQDYPRYVQSLGIPFCDRL